MSQPEETKFGRCEALSRSAGRRCRRAAIGPHGKCGYHGGKTPTKAENPDVGAKNGNINARKHSLYMKRDGYIERQSDEDQNWIFELTESLVDIWRRRHGEKPPKAIRQRLESIAIDMHRVAWANDYFAEEGLTQIREEVVNDEKITAEKLNLWASETRLYSDSIEKRMDKHGLLDPPEDREHEAGTVMRSEDYEIIVEDVDGDDDGDGDEWAIEYESPDDAASDGDSDE